MSTIRHTLLLFILLNSAFSIGYSQAGEWTWVKGDNVQNSDGNFGVQGVPSPANEPPSRYDCGFWTDTAGNFWVYSGCTAGNTDDLWQFDPLTLNWTWMKGSDVAATEKVLAVKGVYNAGNTPGLVEYGMFTWITPDNHLWLFGGNTSDITVSNDLWQYDPAINQWAWMGTFGPANYGTMGVGDSTTMPGGRHDGNSTWTDSVGNLWLFGGCTQNTENLNDMWEYNVSAGIWTWMSGTSNGNDPGSYGVMGQPSVNHYPSARSVDFFWKDDAGNFWLAGGYRYFRNWMFQDVWSFDPQNLQWTWVKGLNGNDTVEKGADCVTDTANSFGPRFENRAGWKICDNLVITFGGNNELLTNGIQNDMWAYKAGLNSWEKINVWAQGGSYGLQGVANPANAPHARISPAGFKDKNNNLWMFSGLDVNYYYYNDLWEYVLDTTCTGSPCNSIAVTNPLQDSTYANTASCREVCNGSAGVVATGGVPPYRYKWQPGGDSSAAITGLCAGTYTVTVTDANNSTITDSVVIFAPVEDSVFLTADKYSFCSGDTSHICAPGGYAKYGWTNNDSTICIGAVSSATYSVTVTDSAGCSITSDKVPITVYPLPVNLIYADTTIICSGDSTQICAPAGYTAYQWNYSDAGTGNCTEAANAGNYYVNVTDSNGCTAGSNHLAISVYPVPTVSIIQQGDTLSSYGQISYQWIKNGLPIDSAAGPVYVAPRSGSYEVQVTDTNGCTTTSNPVVVTVTNGLQDLVEENISIYPNPNAVGSWELAVGNELVGSALQVFDEEGRIVFNSKLKTPNSKLELNVPAGVYYLQISNGKVSVVRKLVKM